MSDAPTADSRTALFVWACLAKTEVLFKELRPYPCPGDMYQEAIRRELIHRGHFHPL